MTILRNFLGVLLSLALLPAVADETITILHTNDMHAHVDATTIKGKPYGGYTRLATLVHKYEASDPHPLLLCAGDEFQGTLYFTVYQGLADAALMDYLGYKGMAVGNHEFDKGPTVLAAFGKQVSFPLLSANLDVSAEPALKDIVRASAVVDAGGVKVGLVGATTEELPTISSPGPNVKVNDAVRSVQEAVDKLAAQAVDKIVLLSHCGYEADVWMAPKLRGVDVIVGGHSHTLLGSLDVPNFPRGRGAYPTEAKGADGKKVLIVQAWEWGKVLGRIEVTFDDAGVVKSWSNAAPIPVDESIAEDPTAKAMIAAFQRPIADIQNEPVGSSTVALTGQLMANLIADSMLEATKKMGSVAAFVNAGGVRAELDAGKLTLGQLITVQPFGNTLVVLELTGAELAAAIQHGVESGGGLLLPSTGTSYRIADGKVTDIEVAGAPLDPAKTYTITLNNFTAAGGDAHTVLRDAKGKRTDTGLRDIDVFADYVKGHSPLSPKPETRISR